MKISYIRGNCLVTMPADKFGRYVRKRMHYIVDPWAAIYVVLPASAVGIKYDALANCFAKNGHCLATGKCIIKRGVIYRKKQTNKS